MLSISSSRQFRRENLRFTAASSPSKSQETLCPCFNFTFKSQNWAFNTVKNPSNSLDLNATLDLNTQDQIISTRPARVHKRFKHYCHSSRNGDIPTKGVVRERKYKGYGYGGILFFVLKALESDNNVEKTLNLYEGKLNPREQTVLLKEQRSWEKVVRVFEWMKSQKDYLPNVIHYNVVLRTLGKARKWDELRLGWVDMAEKGVMPTNVTYGILVDVYGKAGLVKEALLWIKHMKLRGIVPDEVTMNTVVRVLKDGGEYDRADSFFKDWCGGKIEFDRLEVDSMTNSESGSSSNPINLKEFLLSELFKTGGRNPDLSVVALEDMESSARKHQTTATYNTLIDLYAKAGRLKDATDVFAEMLKSGVEVDTCTFNTMIFISGSHGHLSEAEALLTKMEERGISPDTTTYNTFLSLYADAGNLEAAYQYYTKIREVGLSPDVVTYRAVLHILCERNNVSAVETVIKEMEMCGAHIDSKSLSVIMRMYVNEGLIDRAKSLFEKCQSKGGLLSMTYAAIIDAYAEKGLWAEAEAVFLCKRDLIGQRKDIVEYNLMIKAYGKAELYEKAFLLFKGMKDHGNWPNECTYNSLIQMLSGGNLVDQAWDLLTEMQGAGFRPSCLTFSTLIASYVRSSRLSDAVDVYQEMARVEVKPNEFVFGSLINGFAKANRLEDALQYFHVMEESGVSANQVMLTSLLKAYSKAGIVEGAKQIYEKMKNLDGGPDVVALNSMISFYAGLGIVSEARVIFDNLREKGSADGTTFANMMYVYKNMGMLDEALEVAEEMKHSGLLRDCVSYSKAMSCYVANGLLTECGEMLHEMLSRKILLSYRTFRVLFTVLKKADVPIEACRQLELSYQEEKPYAKQAVITTVFSVVGLHAFAVEACKTFIKAKMAPDPCAYNVAIKAYGASGEIDEAMRMLMRMQDDGVEADAVTYINLVDCYGKAGMVEGVRRIYNKMKYEEIEPNESIYKAIIKACRSLYQHKLADLVSQDMKLTFNPQPSPDSRTEDGSDYETEEETDFDSEDIDQQFHSSSTEDESDTDTNRTKHL